MTKFFLTGGSRGIGAAIVRHLLEGGHDVAFTYRQRKAEAEAIVDRAGGRSRCFAYQLDVRDSAQVEEVASRALDDLGDVHVAVMNAGISIDRLAANMSDQEWRDVLETNLFGAFWVARHFLPTFVANGFGRLIFISSLGHSGVSGQANYCASKAGMHGLSAALAKEYGRRGVTSNVVVPGFFDTDMTREGMSEANKRFWLGHCPAGRLGELHEVAALVAFLATEGAAFINGQAISVNGGLDWAP